MRRLARGRRRGVKVRTGKGCPAQRVGTRARADTHVNQHARATPCNPAPLHTRMRPLTRAEAYTRCPLTAVRHAAEGALLLPCFVRELN